MKLSKGMKSGHVTGQVYGPKLVQCTNERCLPEVSVSVKVVHKS